MGCGQSWQADESHLPSCHSKAPPAASELQEKGTSVPREKGHPRGDSSAKHLSPPLFNTPHYLCAAQHWLVYSQPLTPWIGAGGSQPGIPPLQNVCSEPWMGEMGPRTCSDRQLAATVPQSLALAPGAARWGRNESFSSCLRGSFVCIPQSLLIQFLSIS